MQCCVHANFDVPTMDGTNNRCGVQGGEYKATVSWDVMPYSLTLYPEAESRRFNRNLTN